MSEWWICMRPIAQLQSAEHTPHYIWLGASDDPAKDCPSDLKTAMLSRLHASTLWESVHDFEVLPGSFLRHAAAVGLLLRLWYRNRPAGICAFELNSGHPILRDAAAFKQLSNDLSYLVQRYQISLAISQVHGIDLALLGTSPILRIQDIFIERAAPAHLPVLIVGEPGCETDYLAHALHVASDRCMQPFESIECEALDRVGFEDFEALISRLSGGFLFLQNIDALSITSQITFTKILAKKLGTSDIRLVACASSNGTNIDLRKQFYAPLLRHLDFLSTSIPPLRQRATDIPRLSRCFLERYYPSAGVHISDEVVHALSNYAWPGNVDELRRIMGKLAVLGGNHGIDIEDVRRFAPELLHLEQNHPHVTNGYHFHADAATVKLTSLISGYPDASQNHSPGHQDGHHYHPSIQKAVDYIATFYDRALTLRAVAQHSCISCSHLCFLLKKYTGMSFKTMLLVTRIEKAKELLATRLDLRITEVSQEVGFGELSHFERMFKKIVGCSPKQYRRAFAGQAYKATAS
jgi:DNA-binding NtrC family response regulator